MILLLDSENLGTGLPDSKSIGVGLPNLESAAVGLPYSVMAIIARFGKSRARVA